MSPKIHATFWSDDDTGSLPPEQKLAFVWLVTGQSTNNIGFIAVSRRAFEHDTGLPFKVLEGVIKALPRAFLSESIDGRLHVWIRRFIHHQWSTGELSRKSNIFKHLVSLVAKLPESFKQALSCEYPALARGLSDLMISEKTLEAPSKSLEAPSKSLEGTITEHLRTSQSISEHSSSEGGLGETGKPAPPLRTPQILATAHRIVQAYPMRTHQSEAITAVLASIDAGCDPVEILDKTRAISAIINAIPEGKRSYVNGAATFFGNKRWMDDPAALKANWLRTDEQFTGIPKTNPCEQFEVKAPKINGLQP